MKDLPQFSDLWPLTTKTGKKEMYAARWRNLKDKEKVKLFNRVKDLKVKPKPEEIL